MSRNRSRLNSVISRPVRSMSRSQPSSSRYFASGPSTVTGREKGRADRIFIVWP